jgi:hypothetical protein
MSISDNIQTKDINVSLELSALIYNEYIIVTKDDKLIITDKGKKLIKSVEVLFIKLVKNGAVASMGDDYEAKISEYNTTFPSIKLPTGKYARTNVKNLKHAFKWFFDNFDFTWDVILEATERYVDEFERNSYKFMRTSQYFVRKQDSDKTYSSDLANYCEIILSGEQEIETTFITKVV